MKMLLQAFLWGCIFIGWSTFVSAADISLKAFEGLWEGTAVSQSDVSTSFPVTVRDLDVEIRNNPDGSFRLVWRTVQRQKGDPNNPKEVMKETERLFEPKVPGKVWHMTPADNPYDGGVTSWAALKKQTLTVYSMTLRDSGGYDMLIYRRSLTGLNMKLDFKALRNGEVRRTASGTLIKSAK